MELVALLGMAPGMMKFVKVRTYMADGQTNDCMSTGKDAMRYFMQSRYCWLAHLHFLLQMPSAWFIECFYHKAGRVLQLYGCKQELQISRQQLQSRHLRIN